MATNLAMLQNLITPLLDCNPQLRNITPLQGTKAYGAHVKPMRIPGKEREPRVEHDNFYWLQEDYMRELSANADWSLTIWRPQIIFGHALGAPMNMLAAIGAYAAICKSRGEPLYYPGGPSGVMEAIDADLLADAILFSLDNPRFANETFNITNGDVFMWENVWPAIASALDMEPGPARKQLLSQTCYDDEVWRRVVERYGLRPHSVRQLVGDSFFYADALFNATREVPPPPALVSTIKLRQAGFENCIDTEDMLRNWFTRLWDMRLLP